MANQQQTWENSQTHYRQFSNLFFRIFLHKDMTSFLKIQARVTFGQDPNYFLFQF